MKTAGKKRPAVTSALPVGTINDMMDVAVGQVSKPFVRQVVKDATPPAEFKLNQSKTCPACGSADGITVNAGDVCFFDGWAIQRRRTKCNACGQNRMGPDLCERQDAPVKEDFSNVRRDQAEPNQVSELEEQRRRMYAR